MGHPEGPGHRGGHGRHVDPTGGTPHGDHAGHDHEDPAHRRARERAHRARRRWRRLVARVRAVRARVRRTPVGRWWWRVVVGVVGGVLLVAGVVMIPGPGQGWATVFLALAILSTEFGWARRLRQGLWDRVVSARRHYAEAPPRRRAVLATAVLVVTAAALAGAMWLSLLLVGVPGWVPDAVGEPLRSLPGVG